MEVAPEKFECHAEKMKTLAAEWEKFKANCVPEQAHPSQIEEARRSFFHGALAMFNAITQLRADASGILAVDALRSELDAFLKAQAQRDVQAFRQYQQEKEQTN